MDKRGLSAVIISLILILLAIVVSGVLWVVISNVVQTGSEEISLEGFFLDLQIENVKVESNGDVSITVKRGAGDADLTGIAFIISDGANSVVVKEEDITLQELGTSTFIIEKAELGNVVFVKEVSIAPIITEDEEEKIGRVVNTEEFAVFRDDDDGMDTSYSGDTSDDGANKWLEISKSSIKLENTRLFVYGQATVCAVCASDDYRLRVNNDSSRTLNFNWCEMFGLTTGTSDYEWKSFEIPRDWLINGENQFNFWDSGGSCGHTNANWKIGFDTDNDNGRSAWSSNDLPSCQPIRGSNPQRQDGTCYNDEAMIFLVG